MNIFKDYITINLWVNLDICTGSCNTLSDLPDKLCAPNKTEEVNLMFII